MLHVTPIHAALQGNSRSGPEARVSLKRLILKSCLFTRNGRSMSRKFVRYAIVVIIPLCLLALFTANFSVDLLPKQRLQAARDQWNAQHLASYQMQVRTAVGLGWSFGKFPLGDYRVTVKDGKVVEAGERNWLVAATDPSLPYRPVDSLDKASSLTMEEIFDYTQGRLAPLSSINIYSC